MKIFFVLLVLLLPLHSHALSRKCETPVLHSIFDAKPRPVADERPAPEALYKSRLRLSNKLFIGGGIAGGTGLFLLVMSGVSSNDPYTALLEPGLTIFAAILFAAGLAMLAAAFDLRSRSRDKKRSLQL